MSQLDELHRVVAGLRPDLSAELRELGIGLPEVAPRAVR